MSLQPVPPSSMTGTPRCAHSDDVLQALLTLIAELPTDCSSPPEMGIESPILFFHCLYRFLTAHQA